MQLSGLMDHVATAVALVSATVRVGSLAWELPHAMGAAKKKKSQGKVKSLF